MAMRVARGLLWFAAIWWGIWFGGQLFNALMVVPFFSADPPGSLGLWGQMRHSYVADFFVLFNPLLIAIALGTSLLVGWKVYGDGRKWAIVSIIAAVFSTVLVLGWMAPTINSLVSATDPTMSLSEVRTRLYRWTVANWIRLIIEFYGFAASLLALTSPR